MPGKGYTAERIITKLPEAVVEPAEGQPAAGHVGVSWIMSWLVRTRFRGFAPDNLR
jgi:hypothetical protein